jgi:hypothetical protein
MESTMINLKLLSTAAILALALPAVTSTASFAQGAGPHHGAAPAARGGGAPAARGGGGPRFSAGGGGPRFSGGGPRVGGGGPRFSGGGGGYRGGGGGGGFIPGAVAGAVIGGAIASQGYGPGDYGSNAYYGGNPYYYGSDGYDGGPDGGPVVQVAPGGGGDDVAYCMQTYRSYDPQSGTYLGFDGLRHPCP